MASAITEGWDAPLWVRNAREKRLKKAQALIREKEAKEQDLAEGEKVAAAKAEAEALWADLGPRLPQLPALYAYATELARHDLKSLYQHHFRPGSAMERSFVLRAANERPELMAVIANEEAG